MGLIGHLVTPGTILELDAAAARHLRRAAGRCSQAVTRLVVQDEVILRVPVAAAPARAAIRLDRAEGPQVHSGGSDPRALLSGRSRSTSSSRTDAVFALSSTRIARRSISTAASTCSPKDERLCAHRDAIHSRIGGSCTIDRFRQLVPKIPPLTRESRPRHPTFLDKPKVRGIAGNALAAPARTSRGSTLFSGT